MGALPTEPLSIRGVIVAVLRDTTTGAVRTYTTKNIITDPGDLFYAERSVQTAIPTNFVDGSGNFDGVVELYNGASAAPAKGNDRSDLVGLVAGSEKTMSSTYPKVADADVLNTGSGTDIVTYLAHWLDSEANVAGIADVIITNPSPGAAEPLLMHAEFDAPFAKTSNETLDVFINHRMNGV